jgi:integrase/recombinase XerD
MKGSFKMIELQSFSEMANQFCLDRESRNKSKKTIILYKNELRYFDQWLDRTNREKTIGSISSIVLRQWFSDLSKTRTHGGIVVNYHIIKAMLNWIEFEFEEATWKNPIRKILIQPNHIPPLEEIPLEKVQLLLDACSTSRNEYRDRAIIKALIDTGARASELLSINLQDVSLDTGKVQIINGKGSKNRITWLGKSGIKAVKEYLKTRPENKPSEPLFLNDEGTRLKFTGLRMVIVRLCRKTNMKIYGLHSFRRTSALTLYRKTHDVLFVSRYLGHSSTTITLRYLNITGEDLYNSFISASPADLLN